MDMAARAHRLLNCKGASRSDFRWDDELGEAGIYLLEVNTQPGMTPLSLVPEQAKLKGVSYGELVERLIAEALAMTRRPCSPRRGRPRQAAQAAKGRGAEDVSPRSSRSTRRAPTARRTCSSPRSCSPSASVVLVALDLPAKAERAAGTAIGEAGFTVSGYQIVGINHMDRVADRRRVE